jgi:hypothetical protein
MPEEDENEDKDYLQIGLTPVSYNISSHSHSLKIYTLLPSIKVAYKKYFLGF